MARMSAAERRALLIDAAIQVMAREGVTRATTRAIVAEAGMQIGVFHYCFHTKEELVHEVTQVIGRRTYAAVTEVLTQSTDPSELIHLAVRAYLADLKANPLEHLLNHELTQHALREDDEAATLQYAGYYAGMEKILTDMCEASGCSWTTPVDQLARLTLATVEGITIQWLVTRDEEMTLSLLDDLGDQLRADAGLS
jgi:AcrR family transcriptional regulator